VPDELIIRLVKEELDTPECKVRIQASATVLIGVKAVASFIKRLLNVACTLSLHCCRSGFERSHTYLARTCVRHRCPLQSKGWLLDGFPRTKVGGCPALSSDDIMTAMHYFTHVDTMIAA